MVTLSESEMFVCTVTGIEAAAVGATIEARRLRAIITSPPYAINSSNSLICTSGFFGTSLIDLESGDPVLKMLGHFLAAEFDPDNPYTLLAYENGKGCFQVGPSRLSAAHAGA